MTLEQQLNTLRRRRAVAGTLWRHTATQTTYRITGYCVMEKEWCIGIRYSRSPSTEDCPRQGALLLDIVRPYEDFLIKFTEEQP